MTAQPPDPGKQLALQGFGLTRPDQMQPVLARTFTNQANALATLARRVGVLSEHHEALLRESGYRSEQAIAGSTQLVIGELCCQTAELHQKLDLLDQKLDRVLRLGIWWEENE